ncbi:MAG: nitroreductase family protein [Deltaproteobacteria bacterium]|nr:nitroreductase family protein [Deltaproteobacteria bacterium]
MSWVTIDQDKCTACGVCVERCACFTEKGGAIIAAADENSCNLCGHCVSLCPTGAIAHSKMNMDNFIELDEKNKIKTDDFFQFIRRRRSHRRFLDKPVPRDVLEKLVDVCRYAPTGSNVQNVEILILQDPQKIKKLSDLTMESFEKAHELLEQRAKALKEAGKELPDSMKYSLDVLRRRNQRMISREPGRDMVFHKAPAVWIFHSPEATSAPKDNAVIASTTVALTAMTMGLESTYIGIFEMAASYHPIVKELNLPAGHKIFSVLIMGYPGWTYYRTVDRKPVKVRFE